MSKETALKADEPITKHGDGEDDDGELEIDVLTDGPEALCTWTTDPDEHRRAYIIPLMADANIDGRILVGNMDLVYQWLKNGTVPESRKK